MFNVYLFNRQLNAFAFIPIKHSTLLIKHYCYSSELAGKAARPSAADCILLLYSSLITCPSRSMMLREE